MRLFLESSVLFLLILVFWVKAQDESEFLYLDPTENAPVIEFSLTDKGDFRKSTKPKVVEFYNPFCAACQNYKPTYLKLSKALFEYVGEDELEVYAISCQVHHMVCDEFNVDEIPLLALFPKGEVQPEYMTKLKVKEKHPNFIIPFLFPKDEMKDENGNDDAQGDDVERAEGKNNDNREENVPAQNADPLIQQIYEAVNRKDEMKGENGNDDAQGDDVERAEGKNNDNREENAPAQNADPLIQQVHEDINRKQKLNSGVETRDRFAAREVENESTDDREGGEGREEGGEGDEGNNLKDEEAAPNPHVQVEDTREFQSFENVENMDIPRLPRTQKFGDSSLGADDASALRARKMVSAMDRFQNGLRQSLSNAKHSRPVLNRDQFLDSATGATNAMKAHTPGTSEYDDRQKQLQSYVESFIKRKGLRTKVPIVSSSYGTVTGNDLPPNHKPVLPYKKEIQKPKFALKVPIIKRMVKMSHEEELILDTTMSFITALRSGVFSSEDPLTKSKKGALQAWFDLLRVGLPPEWALHETIMDLDNNIDAISLSNDYLLKFLKKHELPHHKEWSQSCTKTDRRAGFNCGFWKLLHIVTVGVAEQRGGKNLIDGKLISRHARVFSPMEVAETIKDYIENFFPCTPCKNHFVEQYNSCSNRRCIRLTDMVEDATNADYQEPAKWLWEVHNDVNVRLFEEKTPKSTAMHEQIRVLFPTLESCVACFKDDGTFDEDHVFLHLEEQYWPGWKLDPKADQLLQFHNTEPSNFAYAWIVLFLGIGVIYLLRPRTSISYRLQRKRRIE